MRNFLPTLLEFFALRETEDDDHPKAGYANPFDRPAPNKAPSSNPMGMARGGQKPQRTGPGQRQAPKPVDPGTEFLRQHGYMQKGGSKLSQDYEPPKPIVKPPYKGAYLGQVFRTNGKVGSKRTSWGQRDPQTKAPIINPQTGQQSRGYGSVQSQQYIDAIWDGDDWVSSKDFDAKYGKKK